jgi:hypothetical protein
MRLVVPVLRRSGVFGAATLLSVALAGCGGSLTGSADWFPSLPGFSSPKTATVGGDGSALAAAEPLPSMDDNCPSVEIRTGASTLAIAAKSQAATAGDLRYQLSFTDLARQCSLAGPDIRMRVGVRGRLVVGPAGAPNQVDVPIRFAVVQEGVDPKTITTKFKRLTMAVPPGAANATFQDVEDDLSFPMPSLNALDAYVVYVGFDEAGEKPERKAPAKKSPRKK